MALILLVACNRDSPAAGASGRADVPRAATGSETTSPETPPASAAVAPSPGRAPTGPYPAADVALSLTQHRSGPHRYVLLRPSDSGGASWAITLERPSPTDPSVLAAVAGTYTSADDEVEGLVMLDGRLVRDKPMRWEALLIIESGTPRVSRTERNSIGEAVLTPLRDGHASLLQGHLLVFEGSARPLKRSPELQRRALVVGANGAAIVESAGDVTLASFAADLVSLGAHSAMNLDMGQWSEGWYRVAADTVAIIGRSRRSTSRQSNWLVIRR